MADNQINMINLNEIFQDVKTDQIGRLLNETKDSKTCMWYLICALDGMNDNELLKLAGCTIPQIKEARSDYLMKKYRGNDPMFAEVQDLKNEVKEIVSENKAVRSSIEAGLEQAIRDQITISNQLIKSKDEMIEVLKYQKVDLQRQNEQMKSKVIQLENQKKKNNPVGKYVEEPRVQNRKKETNMNDIITEKIQTEEVRTGLAKRMQRYFFAVPDTRKFIETYLNNESLSVDQKEYLLSCLESGMSMKEIENIFSEKLSVDQMKRLNAIVQNRRNKK
nr:hypothetical protein [uncultured Mediterraneibacter sp.]